MSTPDSSATGPRCEEAALQVRAVCRVHQLLELPGRVGVSAIDKRPVDGPVAVHKLGIYGDIQADREHHGGPWQAVYLLSDEDVEPWAEELGDALQPGYFGENLRIAGSETSNWEVGTQLTVGEVELEVTGPRIPCRTFAERVDRPRWVARFAEAGRPGAYARVLRTGRISAGDSLQVVSRPNHQVTVAHIARGISEAQARRLVDSVGEDNLSPSVLLRVDAARNKG